MDKEIIIKDLENRIRFKENYLAAGCGWLAEEITVLNELLQTKKAELRKEKRLRRIDLLMKDHE